MDDHVQVVELSGWSSGGQAHQQYPLEDHRPSSQGYGQPLGPSAAIPHIRPPSLMSIPVNPPSKALSQQGSSQEGESEPMDAATTAEEKNIDKELHDTVCRMCAEMKTQASSLLSAEHFKFLAKCDYEILEPIIYQHVKRVIQCLDDMLALHTTSMICDLSGLASDEIKKMASLCKIALESQATITNGVEVTTTPDPLSQLAEAAKGVAKEAMEFPSGAEGMIKIKNLCPHSELQKMFLDDLRRCQEVMRLIVNFMDRQVTNWTKTHVVVLMQEKLKKMEGFLDCMEPYAKVLSKDSESERKQLREMYGDVAKMQQDIAGALHSLASTNFSPVLGTVLAHLASTGVPQDLTPLTRLLLGTGPDKKKLLTEWMSRVQQRIVLLLDYLAEKFRVTVITGIPQLPPVSAAPSAPLHLPPQVTVNFNAIQPPPSMNPWICAPPQALPNIPSIPPATVADTILPIGTSRLPTVNLTNLPPVSVAPAVSPASISPHSPIRRKYHRGREYSRSPIPSSRSKSRSMRSPKSSSKSKRKRRSKSPLSPMPETSRHQKAARERRKAARAQLQTSYSQLVVLREEKAKMRQRIGYEESWKPYWNILRLLGNPNKDTILTTLIELSDNAKRSRVKLDKAARISKRKDSLSLECDALKHQLCLKPATSARGSRNMEKAKSEGLKLQRQLTILRELWMTSQLRSDLHINIDIESVAKGLLLAAPKNVPEPPAVDYSALTIYMLFQNELERMLDRPRSSEPLDHRLVVGMVVECAQEFNRIKNDAREVKALLPKVYKALQEREQRIEQLQAALSQGELRAFPKQWHA